MISSGSDEGEIIESSSEKATTTKPSFHDLSVDRPSRLRDSSSRSPASTGASHDKARTRDRSLSLDRPDKRRKRDTEDDRFESRKETRRFKVYYEDGDRERSRVSYADLDRTDRSTPRSSHGDYDSRRQYGSKRPRTRSRSPGTSRHGRYNSTNGNGGRGNIRDRESQKNQNHHGNRSYENRASDDYSVSSRTKVFVAGGPSKHMAEFKHEDATQDSHDDHKAQEINAYVYSEKSDKPELTRGYTSSIDEPDGQIEDTEASPEEPIDEAALIEQRRKRREAIAAKYRTQNTPLLVQALTLGNDSHEPSPAAKTGDSQSDQASECTSSHTTHPSNSSLDSTPQTPDGRSREDSPSTFSIGKDEDLANHSVNGPSNNQQDEPSAADYDPTMDMREDKIRDDQKLHGEDMTSAAYDETQQTQQDVLLPTKGVETAEEKPRKGSDDFDMFAEDDDVDDMFAEQPPKANTHAHTLKAVPLPQGKALDMSMLDNWDDPEGYYKIILGELLDGRYLVQANLGKGMFSGVVRALDSKTKKLVAIKLIRNNDTM
jgi:serine/threonine-protein kinase PRP4